MSIVPGRDIRGRDESGSVLVTSLLMVFVATVLALTVIMVTENEMKVSVGVDDHNRALMVAEAGVQEALWRLRLVNNPSSAPLSGSRVTGFGLPNDDASIDVDKFSITKDLVGIPSIVRQVGNTIDEDNPDDGKLDEIDELNTWRDWTVKLVYGNYDTSVPNFNSIVTHDPVAGPYGDFLVLPSVLSADSLMAPANQERSGKVLYTKTTAEYVADPNDPEVLTMRFLRERDFDAYCTGKACWNSAMTPPQADFNGNGINDMVFYDPEILLSTKDYDSPNSILNPSTLSFTDESPYNVDGLTSATRATGFPVIVIRATGRVLRRDKVVATRTIEARVAFRAVQSVNSAFCSYASYSPGGTPRVHSYDGSQPECEMAWDADCVANFSDKLPYDLYGGLGSNGDLDVGSNTDVHGSLVAKGVLSGAATIYGGSARAGGAITGTFVYRLPDAPPDRAYPGDTDLDDVCPVVDIDIEITKYSDSANNDNAKSGYILPSQTQVWTNPTSCTMTSPMATIPNPTSQPSQNSGKWWFKAGGHYYFPALRMGNNARIIGGAAPRDDCALTAEDHEALTEAPINFYVPGPNGNLDVFDRPNIFRLLRTSEFLIYYAGNEEFACTGGCEYRLSMIAPKATVKFAGNGKVQGVMVVGSNSSFNGTFDFYFDYTTRNSWKGTRAPTMISWREIQ